ncbi:hypothetical protein PE066_19045 [Ramlibacter tataouinensis]|uniref:ATP-dependent DNA ligase n=1 Tax=Ramlibacter tataouinensis TaxID=94132 RepID=UPI0022F3A8AC|nr:hypothetical protein [Ramlibacter tataouinensis]WBY01535.1 hypothetical protein PE066_19045 [Ramlibacter tataouinensis]
MRALASLTGGPHVLDGEVCVLREDGTSDFNLLQERARCRRWYPGVHRVTFCLFDLLVCNGKPTGDLTLTRRKELLRELLKLLGGRDLSLLFVQDLPADANLFANMASAGLQIDGVMAKRKDSTYQLGVRSPDWRKIKRPEWHKGSEWRAWSRSGASKMPVNRNLTGSVSRSSAMVSPSALRMTSLFEVAADAALALFAQAQKYRSRNASACLGLSTSAASISSSVIAVKVEVSASNWP